MIPEDKKTRRHGPEEASEKLKQGGWVVEGSGEQSEFP